MSPRRFTTPLEDSAPWAYQGSSREFWCNLRAYAAESSLQQTLCNAYIKVVCPFVVPNSDDCKPTTIYLIPAFQGTSEPNPKTANHKHCPKMGKPIATS